MEQKPARKQRGALTIQDVAKRAGVSPMTVSRVINNERNVRDSTRDRVKEAVAALNYAPNQAARSLAAADQIRIGLLHSNPSSAYLSEFLVGGLEEASGMNIQLIVAKCDEDGCTTARQLIESGLDGVVLPPPLCDDARVIALLAETRTPAVAVATGRPAATVAAVSIDDHRAAYAMTEHLVQLGHQRIGFVIGNPNQTASERRLLGYRAALIDAGVTLLPALEVQGLFTYRSGLDAAEQLLDLEDAPTAIFASNDDMAAAAVAVAHRRGLDVPGDLTVCGFDDTSLSTTIWPEVTTIHQPIADMSRAAIRVLVEEIRLRRTGQPDQNRHVLLDFTLVRRQSDAAPRRRPRTRGKL